MSAIGRFVGWVDNRLGLSSTFLRPVPAYAMGVGPWLGALAVVAFAILAVTGMMMLPYYNATTGDNAYSSTTNIINSLPMGSLIESVHLYAAYSMIVLAFLHLMRGYFASVQKSPREIMWFVGVGMGLCTLFSGFTGYLLPWTVVSKSATDVSIGIMGYLPDPLRGFLVYVIEGSGSDADLLSHFLAFHVVILPGVIAVLFLLKLHMFEVHGASKPESTRKTLTPERIQSAMAKGGPDASEGTRALPWFPTVAVYLLMLTAVFASILVFIASVFPLQLGPEYTSTTAAGAVPEPEWYFLWVYQIFKMSVFEGALTLGAIGLVVVLVILIFVFPIFDKSERKDFRKRPLYTSIGVTMIYELLTMTYWASVTPGQTIAALDAFLLLVVPAFIIIGVGLFVARRQAAGGMALRAKT